MDTLSEREARIIASRFGIPDGEPKTLDELGRMYGVTRERIRQIEQRAMAKLRHPVRSRVLEVQDDDGQRVDLIDIARAWPTLTREDLERLGFVWCAHCHESPFHPRTRGRRRAYCSHKCRQAAYRERRRPAGAAE
jgi:hypothetical protein